MIDDTQNDIQSVPFTLLVDGQKVQGDFFAPRTTVHPQAVLFIHGWMGKPNTHAADFLASQGYYAQTVYLRGHGKSDGDIKAITTQMSLDDALAAYDNLLSRVPNSTPIAVVGSSYGSYISVLLSAKRSCNGLSLRVPANYPDDALELSKWGRGSEYPGDTAWRLQAIDYTANSALTALHNFDGRVQIIEAGLDDQVPTQTVKNYANAVADQSKLSYHLMPDWPHSLADNKAFNQQYKDMLLEWLSSLQ